MELCYKQQRGGEKDLLNLVVVGHVDAGKSTLMGHLLYLQVKCLSPNIFVFFHFPPLSLCLFFYSFICSFKFSLFSSSCFAVYIFTGKKLIEFLLNLLNLHSFKYLSTGQCWTEDDAQI